MIHMILIHFLEVELRLSPALTISRPEYSLRTLTLEEWNWVVSETKMLPWNRDSQRSSTL